VDVKTAITPSLWMDADPQRLQQIVSNLLTNALKFTPEHGSIEVRLEHVHDRALIVVRDSGIGISKDLLPRIFDRFQQGDSSTTRTHKGLGLGLAIVKHLVEQHGGRITAASDGPGSGSTFTVTFPLLHAAGASQPRPTSPTVDPSLLSGVRVLVVDDEADTRATLRALLEQFGAQPTVVGTAGEAFMAVCQSPPDVLLSDIAMPGEDGYALLRRIRAKIDTAHLPAAALTALVDNETKAHAADAGFEAYLTKPIDPSSLAQALARLVHRGTVPLTPPD
jgi:CheY-like chemotaxis protein